MHAEDIYAVRALRAGASGYLCKDNAESQLEQAIRKVAARRPVHHPAVAERLAAKCSAPQASRSAAHAACPIASTRSFSYIAAGLGVTEIGTRLNLSVKTVSTHKAHAMQKMGFANTAELIQYAVRHRLAEIQRQLRVGIFLPPLVLPIQNQRGTDNALHPQLPIIAPCVKLPQRRFCRRCTWCVRQVSKRG